MKQILTKDNSVTFYNEEAGDYYHSQSGAVEEAFVKHAKALEVNKKENPVIFDICFGLGYNSTAALDLIDGPCTIYCFENDKNILDEIKNLTPNIKSFLIIKNFIENFLNNNQTEYEENNIKLIMVFGDAKELIKTIKEKADFVFFDPFSPSKVPGMWTEEFFKNIKNKMKADAKLSTYSNAIWVRENMKKAGFKVADGPIIGRNSPSTICIN